MARGVELQAGVIDFYAQKANSPIAVLNFEITQFIASPVIGENNAENLPIV